jgi:hypothetical protein
MIVRTVKRWHTNLFCDRESLPNDTIQFPRTWCKRGLINSLFTFKNASTWLYARNINRDVMLLCSADDGGVSAVHAEGNSLKESRRSAKPLYIMRNPKGKSRDTSWFCVIVTSEDAMCWLGMHGVILYIHPATYHLLIHLFSRTFLIPMS